MLLARVHFAEGTVVRVPVDASFVDSDFPFVPRPVFLRTGFVVFVTVDWTGANVVFYGLRVEQVHDEGTCAGHIYSGGGA